MQYGEGWYERLTQDKSDDWMKMFINKAVEHGLKSKSEWEPWNASKRPARRKPDYLTWVQSLCKRQIDGIKKSP